MVDNTPYVVDINGIGATVFVSSNSWEGGAANAFDGNYETIWHSSYTNGTIPSTMKVVFNQPQTVKIVKLYKRRGSLSHRYGGLCIYIKVNLLHFKVVMLSTYPRRQRGFSNPRRK